MIEYSTLREKLLDDLTRIADEQKSGLDFEIFFDTGTYRSPEREGNTVTDYINGVITLTSSDVSSLQDGSIIATQSARLDLIVRLPDLTADENYNGVALETQAMKVNKVRNILNQLTSQNKNEVIDDFSVSTIYQNAVTGERNIFANIGDGITFAINVYWILVQNGISTRDMLFNFDGVNIPYQAVTINHTKTYDTNVPSTTTTGRVENMPIQANWSATFELPAMNGNFFDSIFNCLIGADALNTVHCLNFDKGGNSSIYLVTIGEVNLNGETVKNAGLKITFFEAPRNYYLASFPSTYKVYRVTTTGMGYLYVTNAFVFNNPLTMQPLFVNNNNYCIFFNTTETGVVDLGDFNVGDIIIVAGEVGSIYGVELVE